MKTANIKLFGKDYIISERVFYDHLKVERVSKMKGCEKQVPFMILSDALSINWKQMSKIRFIKRWKLKNKFKVVNLMKHLTFSDIKALTEEVYKLEGMQVENVQIEKKKTNPKAS